MFIDEFDAFTCLADPLPKRRFAAAAEIYRSGRRRGYAMRSSVDCLIAAIAIEYEIPVWHKDRDYEAITGFTELRTIVYPDFPRYKGIARSLSEID